MHNLAPASASVDSLEVVRLLLGTPGKGQGIQGPVYTIISRFVFLVQPRHTLIPVGYRTGQKAGLWPEFFLSSFSLGFYVSEASEEQRQAIPVL